MDRSHGDSQPGSPPPTLADALTDAVVDRKAAADGNHPALRELGESMGADGVELWMLVDDQRLVRTAMWAKDTTTVRPDHVWAIDADDPWWPVIGSNAPVMYADMKDPEYPLGRACGAPITSKERVEGMLFAWPPGLDEYSRADTDLFLQMAEMLSDVCRNNIPLVPGSYHQQFEALIATATSLLLDRHSDDSEDRLVEAVRLISTGLNVNHLVLFHIDDDVVQAQAAWSRRGSVLRDHAQLGDSLRGIEAKSTPWLEIPNGGRTAMEGFNSDPGPILMYPIVRDGQQLGGLAVAIPTRNAWLGGYGPTMRSLAVAMHFYSENRHNERRREAAARRDRALAELSALMWPMADIYGTDALSAPLGALAESLGLDGLLIHERRGTTLTELDSWVRNGFALPSDSRIAEINGTWDESSTDGRRGWAPEQRPIDGLALEGSIRAPKDCHGLTVRIGDAEETLGAITMIRGDSRLTADDETALVRLASILRTGLRRLRLEQDLARQRELESLRSSAGRTLFAIKAGAEHARAAREQVLAAVCDTYGCDMVMWGNRLLPAPYDRGWLFRGIDRRFEAVPIERVKIDQWILDSETIVIVRFDYPTMRTLEIDPLAHPRTTATITRSRLDGVTTGGLVLMDFEPHDYTSAEIEVLSDVSNLLHQFEERTQERATANLHHRYDELRIKIAAELLDQQDATIAELTDGSLAAIGHGMGADVVIFQVGGDEMSMWVSPEGRRLVDALAGTEDSVRFFSECTTHALSGRVAPMKLDDVSDASRAAMRPHRVEQFEVVGTVVSDDSRQATLSVLRLSNADWGALEHNTLVTVGSQLQQAVDAINERDRTALHQSLDELTTRCAAALIEESDADRGIELVLNDIIQSLGAAGAAWIEADDEDLRLDVTHAVRADGEDVVVPNLSFSREQWDRMWVGATETAYWEANAAPLRMLGELTPGVSWTPRMVSPVVAGGRPLAILDVQITAEPGAAATDAVTSALATISNLIFVVANRLRANRLFTTTFESAPAGQLVLDDQGIVRASNAAFRDRFGETVGQAWSDLDADFIAGGPEREIRLNAGRHARWVRVRSSAVEVGQTRRSTVVHVEDITSYRAAQAMLEFDATHDQLTGLGNRRMLDEQLVARVDHDSTVMMVDIDRFKVVNDSLGHTAGDEVLVILADRLRMAVRGGDLVCRFGGDEFAVLLREPGDHHELVGMATRLLDLLRKPIELRGVRVVPTCSIGIATLVIGPDAGIIVRHADWALHNAKHSGRDRFAFFDPDHTTMLHDRLVLEADLRAGIEQEDFLPFFQPEYDLTTGAVIGLEALVRWNRHADGIVVASEFIDVAEEIGLAPLMSQLVLARSCEVARQWVDDGYNPRIRINVTAAQLQADTLESEVQAALSRYRLKPEHLCIEVTERSIMVDIDSAISSLAQIRDSGVEVAIDDFGTGFSSLAWLKRLPVDTLKIDRAFVKNLDTDPQDREIVRTVVGLADALGLGVVAEGVEKPQQVPILIDLGCTRAQGWLWSPAVSAEEIPALLAASPQAAPSSNEA